MEFPSNMANNKKIHGWGIISGDGSPIMDIVGTGVCFDGVTTNKKYAKRAAKDLAEATDDVCYVVPVIVEYIIPKKML